MCITSAVQREMHSNCTTLLSIPRMQELNFANPTNPQLRLACAYIIMCTTSAVVRKVVQLECISVVKLHHFTYKCNCTTLLSIPLMEELNFTNSELCLACIYVSVKLSEMAHSLFQRDTCITGSQRPIGCLKLQVLFRKRATNYRVLLRKMTFEDKAFYGSSPPCNPELRISEIANISILDIV